MATKTLNSWLPVKAKKTRNANEARIQVEKLEDRTAPAIFTITSDGVTNLPGLSLQEAIAAANANPGADEIRWDISVASSIVNSGVAGLLPAITETLTIEGLLAGGGNAKVFLESASKADPISGFYITDGGGTFGLNSIIRNLDITDQGGNLEFNAIPTEYAVKIDAVGGGFNLQNVTISNIDGPAVQIINSPNNIIGGAGAKQAFTFSVNNSHGVRVTGAASKNNLIQQGTIFSNAGDGVLIDGGASLNIVGGFTDAPNSGNFIFLNNGNGVHLDNSDDNRIQRNTIGTNSAGEPSKANALNGIFIDNGSRNNIIGGNDLTAGNKVSGNTEHGIYIRGLTSDLNQIQSNIIGLDPTDTGNARPNGGNGILVEGAPNTKVGSTTTAANYIAGNNLHGVSIIGLDSKGSIVVNNRIGITGTSLNQLDTKRGNVQDGIHLSGVDGVTVGGSGTNAPNIVGANRNGVAVVNGSKNVFVRGNQFGIHKLASGQYPNLGNLQEGVLIDSSSAVTVGGTQSLEGNKISANRNGIRVVNSDNVTMQGNFIGTNLTGTIIPLLVGLVEDFQPIAQAEDGVLVEGSTNIRIGTAAQNGGNLVSRNRHGISVTKGSSNVSIYNNRIGLQSAPPTSKTLHDLGNQDDGVFVDASTNVTIGGTGPSEPNQIARNLDGIQISNKSSNVFVRGNVIRNNIQSGVRIEDSSFVTVGGTTAAAANQIFNRRLIIDTGFSVDGVFIVSGSTNNIVQGNLIGTDGTTATNLGMTANGVLVDGSSNNLIGEQFATDPTAAVPLQSNTIAYNAANGVAVVESTGTAVGNKITGNIIFNNGRLGIDLGNTAGFVTFNDLGDGDAGANMQQNFPVLTLAESDANIGVRVQGTLNSLANTTYRIEFFHTPTPNPTGNPVNYGQGKLYLGSVDRTTDGAGDAIFTFQNVNIVLPAAEFISAVAIDLTTGDTSEFSLSKAIVGAPGPATYVVNNDGNIFLSEGADLLIPPNGTMTLANAIRLANEHPGEDRIVFAEHPQYTISGTSISYYQESRNLLTNGDLPDITDSLIIDGSPFAWPQVKGGDKRFDQNYGVVFNKSSHGFVISDNATAQAKFSNPLGAAKNVVIRHLSVTGGPGVGIDITTKYGGANIQDVVISGFTSDGIRIKNSPNNIIGGSGSLQSVSIQSVQGSGVSIIGAAATGNLVQQTQIGTVFGAGGNGIWIQGANNNTVGGFVGGTGVQIQASVGHGIYLVDSSGTRIQRSTIGDTTANKFPNRLDGIRVQDSPNTLIGGVSAAAGNLIAGNTEQGINILNVANAADKGSAGTQIQSNQIGTNGSPNSGNGILVDNVSNVLIGSTITAANNVDGNNLNGIYLKGPGSKGARIVNTSVGSGGGNILDGILVEGTSNIVIGGSNSNMGGTITSNRRGVSVINSTQVTIQQMTINGNSEEGIRLDNTTGVLIGGTQSTIAGNKINSNRDGVRAINTTNSVTLQANTILSNSEDGVIIDNAGSVVVGTPAQQGGNLIGGNRNGVRVINGSANFSIQNNIIGTNGAGVGIGNTDDGIRLDGIVNALVGGTAPLSPNFVFENRNGLHLANGTTGTIVYGNFFANSKENGILLEGSSNNKIGFQKIAERNVIFLNQINGVYLKPDFTNPLVPIFSNNNTIQGNFIGTDKNGLGNFGNDNAGIYIDGGNNNLIGGTVHDVNAKLEEGNVIGNSGFSGVAIVEDNGPAAGNRILGNSLFGHGKLAIDLNGNIGLVDDNDAGDGDAGANGTQNFPELTFAEAGLVSSLVQGKLNSTANTTFRIEFFGDATANPNGFPTGYGQGKTFLGSMNVTTDGTGNAAFDFFAPVSFAAAGIISATATNLTTNNTSEFALAKAVNIAVGRIEGKKFEDLNGNGVFDAGEPGLQGWVIQLEVADANGVFDGKVDAKATTDASGNYSFATLTDGKYLLSEVQQAGWVQTAGPNPNPMQITGGATISNADFGNFKMMKVFGVKFEDKNANAIRDLGEGPIAGIQINLLDAKTNTVLATTKTDVSGNYVFKNLFVGQFGKADTGFYRVREVAPGYTQTTPNPADFQIVSGKDVGPLDFGNKKGGGGGGGGGSGPNIIVAGVDAGRAPQVKVFSAQSGATLFNFLAYDSRFIGGVRVAKGDVNNDGNLDIITAPGANGGPHVKVFDGTSGLEIQSFMAFDQSMTRGLYVASGDVNNDGFDDIIVGTGSGITTRVKVFDGQTQIELFDFTPYNPFFRGGVTVAAGDVNGDGFADIIVGAGPGGGPHVRVFDGSQFGQGPGFVPTELWGFMAYDTRVRTGVFVATGNITADGRADLIVSPGAGLGGNAQVKVYDGGTKVELYNFFAFADEKTPLPRSLFLSDPRYQTGIRVAAVDFNGDGIDDIATAPGKAKAPRIKVYEGSVAGTHAKLWDALAFDPIFLGGVFVG